MKVTPREDIGHRGAAEVAAGVQPLSVIATPQEERADEDYKLSPEARKLLEQALAEDPPA